MDKILVIQTASLGDVILATPLLEKLHFLYPNASIDFLLKKGNESLFSSHPYLHDLLIWDKSKDKYKHLILLLKKIRHKKYDLIINLQRFTTTGFITAFSNANTTIGFNKNPFSIFFTKSVEHKIGIKYNGIHEVDRNMELLAHLTCNQIFRVKLYPSGKDLVNVIQYKKVKFICIAPASLWKTKQFPAVRWIEFLKDIDKDLFVYFLGSKNDILLCDEIILKSGHENSLNLAGKLSMLESTALMQDAFMNYVNDSSPLHLASATNARVTAVFCSTIPEFGFGPLSDDAVVVDIKENLDCRPCGLHGYNKCPKNHFKCAYNIDINQLKLRLNNG
ncbi:MAG: glycosyltransferase family 9 protein [Bacteroidetes bacterium]|nr:glycosyltransferase family 9 protein [Bacteroidota bacterium]